MNPGELNKRITFRIPVTQNIDGVDQEVFIDGETVWASIKPLRGKEYWQAQAVQNENIVKIITRYRKNIKDNYKIRFVHESKNIDYDIINIINIDMKNQYLEIYCKVVG